MNRAVAVSSIASFAMAVLGTALMSTLVGPGLAGAQPAPPMLPERRDSDMRAEQSLIVTDNGTDRIHLAAGPGSIGALRIFDLDGVLRVHVEMTENPDGSVSQGIALWNGIAPIVRIGSVGRSAELAGRSLGDANLVLRDETGKDRIRLLVADDGTPSLELIGNAETLVWTVP